MLIIHCHLQQEIGEASDDAVRKYYDETPMEDRSDTGVIAAMRAAAKTRHHWFFFYDSFPMHHYSISALY
jgi:hypothetical protein